MSKKPKPKDSDDESEHVGLTDDFSAVELDSKVYTRVISTCTEVVSTKGMASRIRMLEAIASEVGQRRRDFLAAISKLDDHEPAVTMGYGGVTVSISKNGDPLFDDQKKLAKFPSGVHISAKSPFPGCAPGNKMLGSILLPCGGVAIAAPGGYGKTPLAHAMACAGVESYSVVRVGEPLAGYASSFLSKESIAYSLALSVLDSSDIVLDSIKDLLASGGGSMKSGISREALVALSDWSSACCDAGCSLYIPINPSTPDEEVQAMMVEIGKSNSTSLVAPLNSQTWAYYSRRGEGLQRVTGQFDLAFGQDGLAAINPTKKAKSISDDDFTKVVSTVLSRDVISSAARRAMTPN